MCWSDLHQLDVESLEVQWILGMRNSFVLTTSATTQRIAAFISQPHSQQASCFSLPLPETIRQSLTQDDTLLELYAITVALRGFRPIFKNRPLLLVTSSQLVKEAILRHTGDDPAMPNELHSKPLDMIVETLGPAATNKLKVVVVSQPEESVAFCLSRLPDTLYRDKFKLISRNLYIDVVDIDDTLLDMFDSPPPAETLSTTE